MQCGGGVEGESTTTWASNTQSHLSSAPIDQVPIPSTQAITGGGLDGMGYLEQVPLTFYFAFEAPKLGFNAGWGREAASRLPKEE